MLATELAEQFTAYNDDWRGRGGSGDTKPEEMIASAWNSPGWPGCEAIAHHPRLRRACLAGG